MHHAINSIERMFLFGPHLSNTRLQTAGYRLMGKPSDDKLIM